MTTWAPLLLADRSPNLRLLVLRELLQVPEDDPEICELTSWRTSDPMLLELLSLQGEDGAFRASESSAESWMKIQSTAIALVRLGYLGFGPQDLPVRKAAEYLFSIQRGDGSWPIPRSKGERELGEAYEMIPLQTAIPLRALGAAGVADHPQAEKAYEWLLACRLPDGAWPSGVKAGQHVFPAGYRRLAHSKMGCRTNTTFALLALAFHPIHQQGEPARRALDLLLAGESLQASHLGIELARYIGAEPARGFFTYFARNDPALLLDLCWRMGASLDDPRVADLVSFIKELQGPYGLWEHPSQPQASRWLSFDLLRSLSRIDAHTNWFSLEPRTPFQPYPKQPKRF